MNWETTLKKVTEQTALKASALWVDSPAKLSLINNQMIFAGMI